VGYSDGKAANRTTLTLGISGERSLTRPFRDARRFPSTRLYPVPRATRTTRKCGICPPFKDQFRPVPKTLCVTTRHFCIAVCSTPCTSGATSRCGWRRSCRSACAPCRPRTTLRWTARHSSRRCCRRTAMQKLRIVISGFGTARQKKVLERWTNPKPLQPIWDRAAI
jgi:hypothetical protein